MEALPLNISGDDGEIAPERHDFFFPSRNKKVDPTSLPSLLLIEWSCGIKQRVLLKKNASFEVSTISGKLF